MKVRITFIESVLGTWTNNKEIARDFIASKAPDDRYVEDEVNAVGDNGVDEKGMTVFPRNADGEPIFYDYQIKGFFKNSCGTLWRVKSTESAKLKAYKKIIDGLIFVYPREIPIHMSGAMGDCQRPLRAQTAQGERIALAHSEEIPAGSWIDIEVELLDERALYGAVLEWLDYGEKNGIGQWHNSGKGRFKYELLDD